MSIYEYWVVRYVPMPSREEFLNVAVVAGRDEEWSLRAANLRSVRHLGGRPLVVRGFTEELDAMIQRQSFERLQDGLGFGRTEGLSRGHLEDLRHRMNNVVQLREPRPIVATTADEAATVAYDLMVGHPERQSSIGPRDQLVKKLKANLATPMFEDRVTIDAVTKAGHQSTTMDFALHDEQVRVLHQVWDFNTSDQKRLADRLGNWHYLLSVIRKEGGQVTTARHNLPIPDDVAIRPIVFRPDSGHSEPYEVAQDAWARLGVHEILSDDADEVVREAELLVAART